MLTRLRQGLAQVRWLPAAATVGAAALAVSGVAAALHRLSERHLKAEAERTAQGWAQHIARAVEGVDLIFQGQRPSPTAQGQLLALRGMGGLVHYRLVNPDGNLVLDSDTLGETGHTGPVQDQRAGPAGPAPAAAHLSRIDTPVLRGSALLGVLQAELDQGEQAAAVTEAFRRASLVAGAAITLCMLLAAALTRHRAWLERRASERARFLSQHDALTGTLTHSQFNQLLVRACQSYAPGGRQGGAARAPSGLAVICIDLDNFALVNETHGHRKGDDLLRLTAERLHSLLRGRDQLARLAGDRFAVLLQDARNSTEVKALIQRVQQRLSEPHQLPPQRASIRLSASVGVAMHGTDGHDADTLLHNAELALLRAKANGRGHWSFYDPTLDRRLQERNTLAEELRQALAQDGLGLHFQPLYGATDGTLHGYEALARWFHPALGAVPPSDFIPVAEETGQIEALGRWVLHAACKEAARWPEPLSVAVNLSARQFSHGRVIVDEVAQALALSGLRPGRLELEITESLLMNHTEQVLSTLHALRQLGVRIAMDDFGTGFSSLAYLWRFPFDKLKIDRAFTQGLGSDPKVDVIVGSIITLAHSLSIRVNAEGVETKAQQSSLQRHGCDELQGYLLGRPVPAERLAHVEAETAATVHMD